MSDDGRMPAAAAWLGYGGLIPFAATAMGCWAGGELASASASLFQGYSAAILAFLGGVPWGLTLQAGPARERLVVGVLPPLVAWLALALPLAASIATLGLALVALYAWDRSRNLGDVPGWFRRLRRDLTAGAFVAHGLALTATV